MSIEPPQSPSAFSHITSTQRPENSPADSLRVAFDNNSKIAFIEVDAESKGKRKFRIGLRNSDPHDMGGMLSRAFYPERSSSNFLFEPRSDENSKSDDNAAVAEIIPGFDGIIALLSEMKKRELIGSDDVMNLLYEMKEKKIITKPQMIIATEKLQLMPEVEGGLGI